MKFSETTTSEDYPVAHLISEGRSWHICFMPVMFGVRVEVSHYRSPGPTLTLCAGADMNVQRLLFTSMLTIMSSLPEDVSEAVVGQQFPKFRIRPINNDTERWMDLLQKSERLFKADNSLATIGPCSVEQTADYIARASVLASAGLGRFALGI